MTQDEGVNAATQDEGGSTARLSRMGRRFQRPNIPSEEEKREQITHEEPPAAPTSRAQPQEFDFKQRHKTENVTVDRRLLPAYYRLLRVSGHNKSDAINNVMVAACIQAGIEDVPDLSKPFSLDDVREVPAAPAPAIREHQDVEFKLRFKTENLQIDRRLLPAYYKLVKARGRNKTEAINSIIVEACKQHGIEVPNLDKPFSFDDVDPKYRPQFL